MDDKINATHQSAQRFGAGQIARRYLDLQSGKLLMDWELSREDADTPALLGQCPDDITAQEAGCARYRGQFRQDQDRLAAARRGNVPSIATEAVSS